MALNFLPNRTPKESTVLRRTIDAVIAIAGGAAIAALSYHYLLREAVLTPLSEFHLANSYKGGGGTNVVNVILVDSLDSKFHIFSSKGIGKFLITSIYDLFNHKGLPRRH